MQINKKLNSKNTKILMKKSRLIQSNYSFDLWNLKADSFSNDETNKERITNNHKLINNIYKAQLSMPNNNKRKNKLNGNLNIRKKQNFSPQKKKANKSVENTKHNLNKNKKIKSNITKKKTAIVHKTKSAPEENKPLHKNKKTKKEIEAIVTNLYKKKILSNDYEMQKLIKKKEDDNRNKDEMSQCTFKPKLNSYKAFNTTHKNIKTSYEKQTKWLDTVNLKNMKHFEEKMNKEIKDCSFNPKTIKMPNFITHQYNNNNETTELYYMRTKNARMKLYQDKNDKIDYVKNYDKRKRRWSDVKNGGNGLEFKYCPKQIDLLPSQDALYKESDNNDYDAKINDLKLNLHCPNNINSNEEDNSDDFFL